MPEDPDIVTPTDAQTARTVRARRRRNLALALALASLAVLLYALTIVKLTS